MGTEEIGGVFSQMLSSPGEMTIFMVIVVVLGFLVCSFGVQKGLERITKVMIDRKSTRLNSSHWNKSRMPSSA